MLFLFKKKHSNTAYSALSLIGWFWNHESLLKNHSRVPCQLWTIEHQIHQWKGIFNLWINYRQSIEFLALAETWCTDKSSVSLGIIQPPWYSVIHLPRHDRRGGGIGLIYRDSYKAQRVKFEKCSPFEHQTLSLSCGTEQLVVTCVYLISGVFTQEFPSQFSELLSFLQAESAKHLIVGDLNFHVNIQRGCNETKTHSSPVQS